MERHDIKQMIKNFNKVLKQWKWQARVCKPTGAETSN